MTTTHTKQKQFEISDPTLFAFYTDLSDTKGMSKEAVGKKRLGKLTSITNHIARAFIRRSKYTDQLETIVVARGQYFTTYKQLCKIWNCTKDQARYQLLKWKRDGTVKIQIVQDAKGMDLGMLITYNWLYNQNQKSQSRKRKKRTKKIPTPKSSGLADKIKDEKNLDSEIPTLLKDSVSNENRHDNDVDFEKKKEETQEEENLTRKIRQDVSEFNLNPKVLEQLLKIYEIQKIADYLQLLKLSPNISNPAGWLVEALRRDFDLSKVENWRIEEREAERRIKRQQEEEEAERRREEEARKRQERKDQAVNKWREVNGEQAEKALYLEVLEGLKTNNRIIYSHILKHRKAGETLLEAVQKNLFAKSAVNQKILDIVGFSETDEKLEQVTADAQKRVAVMGKVAHMSDLLARWG